MKLVAYARVSTVGQAEDGQGLAIQERAMRRWAKDHGHRLLGGLYLKPHPAEFSTPVMEAIATQLEGLPITRVLDPFAGTGRIHELRPRYETIGIELEPEWAMASPLTLVGDTFKILPFFQPGFFDAIITSPAFGNRMADHHEAKDDSRRHTYKHYMGRPLSEGSSAGMAWGTRYREFHHAAWAALTRLEPSYFLLNVKDHIRAGKVVEVSRWHFGVLESLGWQILHDDVIRAAGQRHGANGSARVDYEHVALLERKSIDLSATDRKAIA